MWNDYWTLAWTLLGPVLAVQVAIVAIAMTIGAVRRRMGYQDYVELGPDMQPEHYTRAVHPAVHAQAIVEVEAEPAQTVPAQIMSEQIVTAQTGPAHIVHAPLWRDDAAPAAVRQFWSYPARPCPTRARPSHAHGH